MSETPVRTLLERLENAEEPPETSQKMAEERLLESVRESLQRILNTPRGFSTSSPELGLGELIDANLSTRSMGKIEGELRRTIERYEPRLSDVRVSYVSSGEQRFTLRFDIRARVRVGNTVRDAQFQTQLESQRPLEVRRR
jgi:type VI secretion system protein